MCQNKGILEGVGCVDTLPHLEVKDYNIMQLHQALAVVGLQRSNFGGVGVREMALSQSTTSATPKYE